MKHDNDNWPAEKLCSACGQTKPLEQFHRQPSGKYGRHSYCADCACEKQRESRVRNYTPEQKRKWTLKTRYGLTVEEYDGMLMAQGGLCAICRTEPTRPCVDHAHDTGQVRSILCHRCNIGLPYVEDESFRAAAMAYLAEHHRRAA